jgi:hypothetical protein
LHAGGVGTDVNSSQFHVVYEFEGQQATGKRCDTARKMEQVDFDSLRLDRRQNYSDFVIVQTIPNKAYFCIFPSRYRFGVGLFHEKVGLPCNISPTSSSSVFSF